VKAERITGRASRSAPQLLVLISIFAIAPAPAQDKVQERFDNVAALAAAYLDSAESIEWRLNQDGATLHPETIALCSRITASLNRAQDAIHRGSTKSAEDAMNTAEALVERLAKKLGG